MIDSLNHCSTIKVGFDEVEERLLNYQSKFDIVITHDDWFEELLKNVL